MIFIVIARWEAQGPPRPDGREVVGVMGYYVSDPDAARAARLDWEVRFPSSKLERS